MIAAPGNYATTVDLIRALVWPVVVLLIAWRLKGPLSKCAKSEALAIFVRTVRRGRLKAGGLELEIDRELVEATAAAESTSVSPGDSQLMNVDRAVDLASKDPDAAVVAVWEQITAANESAQRRINPAYQPHGISAIDTLVEITRLIADRGLGNSFNQTVRLLYNVYSASRQNAGTITPSQALVFVRLAQQLGSALLRVE